MKKLIIGATLALALAPASAFAGGITDATPGQTITRGQPVNPAIEAFLVERNIVTTNALERRCAGQVISSGLETEYACWLAEGLAQAWGR